MKIYTDGKAQITQEWVEEVMEVAETLSWYDEIKIDTKNKIPDIPITQALTHGFDLRLCDREVYQPRGVWRLLTLRSVLESTLKLRSYEKPLTKENVDELIQIAIFGKVEHEIRA